ncbi:uncharacterized protein METZ01_LOCUS313882, partial [marine metagenome]
VIFKKRLNLLFIDSIRNILYRIEKESEI